MAVLEETALLAGLQQPDTRARAFDQMVRTYQRVLYYHIRRLVVRHEDADDVLQNTFLKAWRYLDQFRGESALKTWLYRIATNEALTFLNQQKRRAGQDVEDLANDLRHSLRNDRYIEGDEIQLRLQEAILLLPDRQRTVFSMRYFDELKYEEISEVLDVSVGALKASYHHAVRKIEDYLTGVASA
jgi:RNA polymerase sigma-70 factor (ECF subfamily)